jgi:hypothetical protein
VLTNNKFMLSDAQIAAYNSWAAERATHIWTADAAESHEIEVRFTFTPFGRVVEAIIGGSNEKLVLEDCYE